MTTLWVTWEEQRRNKEIADSINADFHEIIVKGSRLRRYLGSLWQTFNLYRTTRPDNVICQNPSVVLALFTVLTKRIFGFQAGVDTHNGGLALDSDSKIMKWVAKFLQRNADFIIVTNEPLRRMVKANGGRALVLPDKIPTIERPAFLPILAGDYNFLFICTFAKDEPYNEVFEEARVFSGTGTHIYVTGNHQGKVDPKYYELPNLHFLGRIPWEDFDATLYAVDGIIDLTTREYCLICGAYEAVAVEKPLIISDTSVLMSYFNKGAVYTDNTAFDLAGSINCVIKEQRVLNKEVKCLKQELQDNWEMLRRHLEAIL